MEQAIYNTLKSALEMKIKDIIDTDRYYEDPELSFYDLNAEERKVQLKECFAAREWLISQKKAGIVE